MQFASQTNLSRSITKREREREGGLIKRIPATELTAIKRRYVLGGSRACACSSEKSRARRNAHKSETDVRVKTFHLESRTHATHFARDRKAPHFCITAIYSAAIRDLAIVAAIIVSDDAHRCFHTWHPSISTAHRKKNLTANRAREQELARCN